MGGGSLLNAMRGETFQEVQYDPSTIKYKRVASNYGFDLIWDGMGLQLSMRNGNSPLGEALLEETNAVSEASLHLRIFPFRQGGPWDIRSCQTKGQGGVPHLKNSLQHLSHR